MEDFALAPFNEKTPLVEKFLEVIKDDNPNVKAAVYDFIFSLEKTLAYNEGKETDRKFLLVDGIIRNKNLEFNVLNIPFPSYALSELPLVAKHYQRLILATQMLLSSSTMGVTRMGSFPRVKKLLARRDIANYLTSQLEEAYLSQEEWKKYLENLKQEQETLERRRFEEEEARRREEENLAGEAAAQALALAEGIALPEEVPERTDNVDVIFSRDVLVNDVILTKEDIVKIEPIKEYENQPRHYLSYGPYQGAEISAPIDFLLKKIPGVKRYDYHQHVNDRYVYLLNKERMLRFDYFGNLSLDIMGTFDPTFLKNIIFVENTGEFLISPLYTDEKTIAPFRLYNENGEPTDIILNIDKNKLRYIYAGSNFYVIKAKFVDDEYFKFYFYNRNMELERIFYPEDVIHIHGIFSNDRILISEMESGLFYILDPDLTLVYALDLGIKSSDFLPMYMSCILIEELNRWEDYEPVLYCKLFRNNILKIYPLDTKTLLKPFFERYSTN